MVLGFVLTDGLFLLPSVCFFIGQCIGNLLDVARFALNIELSAGVGINHGAQSVLDLRLDITVISLLNVIAKRLPPLWKINHLVRGDWLRSGNRQLSLAGRRQTGSARCLSA